MRIGAGAAAAIALLLSAAPTFAETRECKAVVIVAEAEGILAPVTKLATTQLRSRIAAITSCALVDDAAVAGMRAMVKLPPKPLAEDWFRLGRSLVADHVVVARLVASPGEATIRIGVTAFQVGGGGSVGRRATVPAVEMLPTLLRLAGDVLRPVGPASAPSVAPPSSRPSSQPASSAPAPRAPPQLPAGPAPAVPPPAAAPAVSRKRATPRRPPARLFVGAGVKAFYLFRDARGGPVGDFEIGARHRLYRKTFLFRSYFGDKNSYFIGGRLEGGPRLGRFRLSLGVDLGLLLVPDTIDVLDMLVLNAHAVGLVIEWSHILVHLDLFALDLYLIPANTEIDRAMSGMFGFSSGVSVAFFL